MQIQFLGAAKGVTGSNYLITTEKERFVLDCGMFQGSKAEEAKNASPFAYDPGSIDFAILTHAHIDHSGRLPKLVKEGFTGNIYATHATTDLCEIMLADSANIQENDVAYENKKRQRAGLPLLEPLYTKRDVERTVRQMIGCHYDQVVTLTENIRIRFRDAGHILGSSIVELWVTESGKTTKVVFSGDLGLPGKPIICNPSFIKSADVLVMESTYGATIHDSMEASMHELISIIHRTAQRGGSVVIPSFAVGRTQEIVYNLNQYYEDNKGIITPIPVYIDSPLASNATKVFMKNTNIFNEEARGRIQNGDNVFEFENLRYTASVEESKMLNKVQFPRVIISASGMATAGRIRHHLKHNLWDERSTIVFVGYQAQGTLGRILLDGAKEVKLFGDTIAVKAEIVNLAGFSGHADQPMLLRWVDAMERKPKRLFLTHGEPDEMEPLAKILGERYDFEITIPQEGDVVQIQGETPADQVQIPHIQDIDLQQELRTLALRIERLREQSVKSEGMEGEELTKLQNRLQNIDSDLMDIAMILGQ